MLPCHQSSNYAQSTLESPGIIWNTSEWCSRIVAVIDDAFHAHTQLTRDVLIWECDQEADDSDDRGAAGESRMPRKDGPCLLLSPVNTTPNYASSNTIQMIQHGTTRFPAWSNMATQSKKISCDPSSPFSTNKHLAGTAFCYTDLLYLSSTSLLCISLASIFMITCNYSEATSALFI